MPPSLRKRVCHASCLYQVAIVWHSVLVENPVHKQLRIHSVADLFSERELPTIVACVDDDACDTVSTIPGEVIL
jgi:hypothetical protein